MRTLLLLAALLVIAAPARAATYDVALCADPANPGFTKHNDDESTLATEAECPPVSSDPFSGVYVGARVGVAPGPSSVASWEVSAPAGTTFRSFTFQRRLAKSDPGYEVAVVTDEGAVIDGCPAGGTCLESVDGRTWGTSKGVTFRVRCAAGPCGSSAMNSRAWLVVTSASATVNDPDPPTVAPPAVGGWQRTPAVPVGASDASGVSKVSLVESGQVVVARAQACDYRHLQPCPGTVGDVVAPELADGVHSLVVVATDAAGQSATSAPVTLKLDRKAPLTPAGLSVQRVGDGDFVYSWHNPDESGTAPIVAAHWSDGIHETVVKGAGIERLEAASGDGKVWLEDEAGNADAANAAVLGAGPNVVPTQKPILKPTTKSPKLKVTKLRRSGRTLTVRGTIARQATGKVTVTVRNEKKSVKPVKGRFAVRLRVPKGRVRVTVRYAGQGGYSAAAVKKTLAR
jgi:hypothetical protein